MLQDGRIVCARNDGAPPETPAFTGFSQVRRELPALSGTSAWSKWTRVGAGLLRMFTTGHRSRDTIALARLLSRHRERPTAPGRSLFLDHESAITRLYDG